MTGANIVAVARDPAVIARLERLARTSGASLAVFEDVPAPGDDEPAAVVVELEIAGALEAAAGMRARWPRALLAGFVSLPDPARWEAAETAGFDLVATRGTIAAQLEKRLASWQGPPERKRARLLAQADAAGRLGLVVRLPDTPVGPVAVYQIGSTLYAAGDVCPHAGAILSEGGLAGAVVTCPLHGSQFDVRTGARLRGPADAEIPTYRLVTEGGSVFLEYE
jgi:nitrite reductase/ring-hydroxylating ferredoxin subunit